MLHTMTQQDGLPLVFHFAKEDREPEEQEYKELWDDFDRALMKSPRLLPRPCQLLFPRPRQQCPCLWH